MKWRWPWRRETAGARPAAGTAASGRSKSGPRLQWLGWDGRTLRWRLEAVDAIAPELRIDGIALQRLDRLAGERVIESGFDFSPTGNDELEFSIGVGDDRAPLASPWRVRFGAAAAAGVDQWSQARRFLAPLAGTPALPALHWSELPAVAVIVPIYNAAASVQRCLDALAQWTPPAVRWVLVDDASDDPAIATLLDRHARRDGVRVERHERNRGYTSAVNTGIAAAGAADVVLLNSDTEVGPRWLESLRLAAYGDDTIGTVTAASDNAGAFSVPELEQYCPIPGHWSLVEAQRAVLQQAGLRFPELPTGNGFCMFVKRAVIDRVGAMDAEAFPAGYGEENDFCQRAIAAGWRNVVAGNVLVRHQRSASFGDARRAALGAQGMQVLRARWPRYEADVGAALHGFDRRVLDYRVRRSYAGIDGRYASAAPRERVLILGGDPLPVAEVEPYRLYGTSPPELRDADDSRIAVATAGGTPMQEQLRCWLVAHAIERVVPERQATAFGALVADAAASLGIPLRS